MTFSIEEIRNLPKTDLHVHLDGSIRLSSLIEFSKKLKLELPSYTVEGLKELVFKDKYKDLPEYLECFAYTCAALMDSENLEQAAYELAIDAFKDGVYRIEPRYCPSLMLSENNNLNNKEIIAAIEKGLSKASKEINSEIQTSSEIQARLNKYSWAPKEFSYSHILCIMRHWSPQDSKAYIEELLKIKAESGLPINNIDLAGPENGFPVSLHSEAFELCKALNKTIHAGEADGPESIEQAIKIAGAKRIGHGVNLFNKNYSYSDAQREELINLIKASDIHIEVCLTSNLQTSPELGMDPKNHSLRQMLDHGLNVNFCTDNTTVSNTTVSDEIFKAQTAFNLGGEEIESMLATGFKAKFEEFVIKN
ncbi:MAG: adenosine deaminase family protein [Candidatus Caenarcaniphilales bacterium]|nr:adenosine deaminase family protein [Candidatus Caenarcaniphilales bacterium]